MLIPLHLKNSAIKLIMFTKFNVLSMITLVQKCRAYWLYKVSARCPHLLPQGALLGWYRHTWIPATQWWQHIIQLHSSSHLMSSVYLFSMCHLKSRAPKPLSHHPMTLSIYSELVLAPFWVDGCYLQWEHVWNWYCMHVSIVHLACMLVYLFSCSWRIQQPLPT